MRLLFFALLLFCCSSAFSQPMPITLNGAITMATGETFPYRLVLTEVNGVAGGYSITYKEPDDTKTKVQGTLDRRSHTLTFKETEIVYSHNVRTKAYMCLIDAKLTYSHSEKGYILKGPITGKQADQTACTGGSLVFSKNEEVEFLFGYHDKGDTMITMKKKVKEPVVENNAPVYDVKPAPITEKVTAGIEKSYDWHTDTVIIDVWDGGNVDGDRITLQFNGKTYLANYFLNKEKKQLRIPLTGTGINIINIIADNEGSDPPNTASLLFTDGSTKYSVLAYNKKGDQAVIKIKKVK